LPPAAKLRGEWVSRLTDLIAQAKAKDPALGSELEREFKVLSSRRSFGLNFERHRPESVELPGRPVRKGDKVHILPPRGSTTKGDQRLWKVTGFEAFADARKAKLELLYSVDVERQSVAVADLIVVAEFKDYIYPGLVSTGKVERGDGKPFHTVINGENFHVLEALTFTHRGKIDAIYIDPPYNSGAKDWKYNNSYIGDDDIYRHSKWLAMIERRLETARMLLRNDDSILIVTIDEKEYLRLGLLLEDTFPEAKMQMVTSVISPAGQPRANQMSRVEEYIFILYFGSAKVGQDYSQSIAEEVDQEPAVSAVSWENLIRRGTDARRVDRENQFYPIFFDPETKAIHSIGEPLLPITRSISEIEVPENLGVVWPIRSDGSEGRWRISSGAARNLLAKGFLRLGRKNLTTGSWAVNYVLRSDIERISRNEISVLGYNDDGSAVLQRLGGSSSVAGTPKTVWNKESHNAGNNGSALLRIFIPERKFPFPKSLYAVEDVLRLFVLSKPKAKVLDFFAGSGTTAHALMRINRQDDGSRQCISVTNNEVGADEHSNLRKEGLRPGDAEWERWGICDYITKPRIAAAITGRTPEGKPIKGDYKFNDEFPMAEGFEENAEFFTLTYETPVAVTHNRAFERIAPLLWMRAGSEGRRIDKLPDRGWEVADTYGLLIDLDHSAAFAGAMEGRDALRVAYVVTDDDRRFQSVVRQLPGSVEPVRLYESYLTNFRFAMGR
jgi:adenine-specific DNA-methyltransferase